MTENAFDPKNESKTHTHLHTLALWAAHTNTHTQSEKNGSNRVETKAVQETKRLTEDDHSGLDGGALKTDR